MVPIKKWRIGSEESGMKLLAFLKKQLPEFSSRFLKNAVEQNHCQVNEKKERFASFVVGKGDLIVFSIPASRTEKTGISYEQERVLYENDDLLFYNKPAGISSDDKEFLLLLQKKHPAVQLLHRLDRGTTGVLMFAKSEDVRIQVIGYFRKHLVEKIYYALVDGIPKKKQGVIDNYLGKKTHYEGQSIWGEVNPQEGHHAVTAWELVKQGRESSIVRCFPKTGRTHQLRVHLSGIGHPILGDFQYGNRFRSPYRPGRCLLHAAEIAFEHPANHLIRVAAPLPNDFLKAMEELQCIF